MPTKGDWKKPFEAAAKMVQDSKTCTLRLLAEKALQLAHDDGMIHDPKATIPITRKNGRKFLLYHSTPEMNRYLLKRRGRDGEYRKVFHENKFVSRTGGLAKALTPGGCKTRIEQTSDGNTCLVLRFEGREADILSGADSKMGRNKIDITDKNGSLLKKQAQRGRRRPIQNAFQKLKNFWDKNLKGQLDARARNIK
jgi:hypothetical protein